MSSSNRAALGGGIDPKCSKAGGTVTTPDFVEVSPLMRSCIFGFNTQVAELPSSAADVKASGVSLLGSCINPSADETAVHKAFLSQLPADLLSAGSFTGTALEKAQSPTCLIESLTGAPDETSWWSGARQSIAEEGRFLSTELRARLADLANEANCQGDTRDSRVAPKSAACIKRVRQAARRLPGAGRASASSAPCKGTRDLGSHEPPEDAAEPLVSLAAESAQPVRSCLSEHDATGNACSVTEQQGEALSGCSLLGALSLSLDKLAEQTEKDVPCLVGDSTSCGSPDSSPQRGHESCDSSLHPSDLTPLLDAPTCNVPSKSSGSFFRNSILCLPHGTTRSFQTFEDLVEPTTFLAHEGRHAAGAQGGNSPMRVVVFRFLHVLPQLPQDAGDVFAEIQTTMLALLEDLHAATCCCAPASSQDPCSCCFGSLFLMKGVDIKHGTVTAEAKTASPCGNADALKDSHGEPSTPLSSHGGTRNAATGVATRLRAGGPDSAAATDCSGLTEKKEAGKNGSDSDFSASYTQEALTSSPIKKEEGNVGGAGLATLKACASHVSVGGGSGAAYDHVQMPSYNGESSCAKCFSGPTSKREQRSEHVSFLTPESTNCADSGVDALANPPHSSTTKSSPQLLSKGSDFTSQCAEEGPEGSLHLLFRHHVAVVACADLFSELLPYSHIFRECVGTYRMPTTLPSSARHLLVQELFLLRQDPDRLLARNSFQWTGTAGAVACLADRAGYFHKGGNADGLQPDRLPRGDDMGRCLSTHSSVGMKVDAPSGCLSGEGVEAATSESAVCAASKECLSNPKWMPPLPLLDPTLLLGASGREMALQKSAVLRLLRMLRSLAPSWAARDDNFGFHFKSVVSAASLDSKEFQSYRIVLQCLSPFDAREWSRDQILEVLSDLDCIRLAHRRRRSLRSGVARVQRFVEQREADFSGNPWQMYEGVGTSRQRWEKAASVGGAAADVSAHLPPSRQVVRGGREASNAQHATSTCTTVDSPRPSTLPQPANATKEQNQLAQHAALQQMLSSSNNARSASKMSTVITSQQSGAEGIPYGEKDADLLAMAAGGGSSLLAGSLATSDSSRRVQSPAGSSVGVRRNAASADTNFLTCSSAKAGSNSPGDCPARHQYAERAAELPKIKGVFIGKKHTCWVAQWNDANGQPRQSCFNIKQHGFEKARRLAVQARQALMGGPTSQSTSMPSGETQDVPALQSAPSPSAETAPNAAKLPDLLLTRDPAAAIAEALGSRIVQTPTAVGPPLKLKLESPYTAMGSRGFSVNRNLSPTTVGKGVHTSINASHADIGTLGNVGSRGAPRLGETQRPPVVGVPAELSVAPAELELEAARKEGDRATSLASSVPSSGAPPKQQLLMQHRLQQQLEAQLQQLQHLQQQLMQQPFSTAQPSVGALASMLPDVTPSRHAAPPHAGAAEESSSSGTLMSSLFSASNAKLPHVAPSGDQEHVEAQEHSENLSALRLSEAQRQLPTSREVCARAPNHQLHARSLNISCADAAVCGRPDEAGSSVPASFSAAEALEEDVMPGYAKRKHRLLYVQKHGKRTLASLAREFPSVGGVAYNVKCACWEVTIRGKSAAKVFSTRKFGSLEAAYGAAVMWKRKVERGEEGADDADGPDGQEDDAEEVEEQERVGSGHAGVGSGLDGDESLRKRAAYFKPEICTAPLLSLPQQLSPAGLPSLLHPSALPDGGGNHVQQHFSRTTSL
ncbi:hypothetical protein Emed_004160 [Eimeria media]